MHKPHFTQEQLAQVAKLSDNDLKRVNENRGMQSKLGYAYQLCYIKLFNRLPIQSNFESVEELATFVGVQLDITREMLPGYAAQKATFFRHQEDLCSYLHLEKFNDNTEAILRTHLFQQALQIHPTESLFIKATEFLKERRTLNPSDDTIERLIKTQREKARKYILEKIYEEIAPPIKLALDDLLIVGTESYSKLYQIKEVPQKPSAAAIKALANKLVLIEQTGVLTIKLDWLNNNYKRYFSQYVIHADANKLGELTPLNRYTSLVCFLQEAYRDTIDHIFDMYQKAIGTMYNQADKTVDTYNKTKRANTRSCLTNHKKLCGELLAIAEGTADIEALFKKYPHAHLQTQIEEVEELLTSKYSYNLNVVADRFSHMRQLAKPLLEKFTLELAPTGNDSLMTALQIVREIMQGTRRGVPGNTNLDFLPKAVRQAVKEDGGINRRRYEAAVFTALRDHIKCGNMAITGSKRFGKLEDFFISTNQWEAIREEFFKKNKLPQNPKDVPLYFESRLNNAFEYFLQREKNNIFAKVGKEGWEISKDPSEDFTPTKKQKLEALIAWLSERMRTIKLPDLLIEVDNDLHFTNDFLPASKRNERNSNDVCNILTTIMAYGCNIGPHIMAQMITGISYQQIKHMFDWQLTDDAHRIALADVVNGIGSIEITKAWGDGKTAGADGQRFGYRRKTLQRTFSHKFNDFAIEFYIFVADNYAPFYNLVKEATDRDSSKVLDGYLYNVSDLDPDEWYYDTHGYTEVNFAAFAMLGKTFSPRIKNIKTQWIYKINDTKDFGSLNKLVKGARHTIKMNPIVDQWDRMAQFYASFEAGHVTASTALKRLTGYTEKNLFYHANLQMGRILKTEHILLWMSDPFKRKRTRKGLLKVEQIHQLAREITYGNRGRLKGKSMEDINSSGNCTTLIMGAIIYWQAKEISRIIKEHNPEEAGIDIMLLAHISPIAWSNVILYGEYKLNKDMVR